MPKAEEFELPTPHWERWENEKPNPNVPTKKDGSWDIAKLKEQDEQVKKEFWAAPYDARFPQCNKSRQCFIWYQDYHRCTNLLGEDYKACHYFKNVYRDVCPTAWIDKFDGWVERGIFPARFDR